MGDSKRRKMKSSNVKVFIDVLKQLVLRKDDLVKVVKYPKMLLSALKELDSMIEMESVKEAIISEIKTLIIDKRRFINNDIPSGISSNSSIDSPRYLNSVISGPPGVGKTSVAHILARIFASLGLLKQKTTVDKPDPKDAIIKSLTSKVNSTEKRLNNAESKIHELKKSCLITKEVINRIRKDVFDLRDYVDYPGFNKDEVIHSISVNVRSLKFSNEEVIQIINKKEEPEKPEHKLNPNASVFVPVEEKEPDDESVYVIATREDLVAEFIGQTAPKTRAFLDKAMGKVVIIDEAYSLASSDSPRDFGLECLTVICEYASKYPGSIAFSFLGYSELLEQTIFRVQKGLKRRCRYQFKIEGYTSIGISKIFLKQLTNKRWLLDPIVNIELFFEKNKEHFKNYGGDTANLLAFCEGIYSTNKFDEMLLDINMKCDNIITLSILKGGLKKLITNDITEKDKGPPSMLYA